MAHRADFLQLRVAEDLADRLSVILRTFDPALMAGPAAPAFLRIYQKDALLRERLPTVFTQHSAHGTTLISDEEWLPFGETSLGLIASLLSLHTVNDVVGALVQARRALKPDGLYVAALFGGQTLHELRHALLDAEVEITGGAAMRVSPFGDTQDFAGLLQRAGFALPVADSDVVTVRYDTPLHLIRDLRAMGETLALHRRPPPLRRAVFLRAMELYHQRFADADGRIRATFEIIWATGWAPHESQQKPLRPGSAKMRLADALNTTEQSAGDKAGR